MIQRSSSRFVCRRSGAVSTLMMALVMLSGCGESPPPNLILITLDTVRADHLGCYGDATARTPQLDALAADGTVFTRAYTPYPLTLPAHTSILSGLLPFAHGIRNNDMPLAADGAALVSEQLRAAGYATAAVVSAFVLDRRFGLARGFDRYLDTMPVAEPDGAAAAERRGDATTDLALGVLDELGAGPFFLWIHYFDPHAPYAPPAPFAGAGYAGEISYVDAQLGRLFDVLRERGLYADAAIIVAGDHGEAFGEHGEQEHGHFIYDTTLQVPLIVKLPGAAAATGSNPAPAGLADIAPTLLALAGVDAADNPHARDLRRLAPDTERELYAETLSPLFNYGASPLSSLRRGELKYIEAPQPELYRLDTDPGETDNLIAGEVALADDLRRRLDLIHPLEWMTRANPLAPVAADAATVRKLASLGYAATGDIAPRERRPDPKDVLVLQRHITRGDAALAAGRLADAEAAYRAALAGDPENWKAVWKLAAVLERQGSPAAAAAVCEDLIARDPAQLAARLHAARLYVQHNQAEPALVHLDRVLQAHPDHTAALNYRGAARLLLGRRDDARRDWEKSLALDPSQTATRQALERNFGPRGSR